MTGTGKTYTIFGTKNCPGLVPHCCNALFESALHRVPNDTFLEISCFEIYNEHVYDLLANSTEDEVEKVSLRVREHPSHGPYVENLSKHAVSHLADVQRLIDRGMALRATAETLANPKSSRSHSVVTIYINQNVKSSSGVVALQSKLHLIDLAGSEKIQHTRSPCYMSETKSINKSLCTLSLVIRRLADMAKEEALNAPHSSPSSPSSLNHLPMQSTRRQRIYVPYRDSKLTWLLRDSLGGHSKTAVIVTVSSSEICRQETLRSLRFAQRIRMIKNHPISNKVGNCSINQSSLSAFWKDINGDSLDRLKGEVGGWRKLQPQYGGLQMQLCRHKGLQTSLVDILLHKVDNLEGNRKTRKQRFVQRGTQCFSERIARQLNLPQISKNRKQRPPFKLRSCHSENLDPLEFEAVSNSSKITLNRGCQTYHVVNDSNITEIISMNTESGSFDIHLPIKLHSRSLPNIYGKWRDPKPLFSPFKSTLEWIRNQDPLKRIYTSGSSTRIISTDSLDILIPQDMDEEVKQFKHTPKSDLFVPEFIPLPSVNSPISLINPKAGKPFKYSKFMRKDGKCLNPHHEEISLKAASYADLTDYQAYFQSRHEDSPDHTNDSISWQLSRKSNLLPRGLFLNCPLDAEPDVLTAVTSLRASTSSFGDMNEENRFLRIQTAKSSTDMVNRIDEGKYGNSYFCLVTSPHLTQKSPPQCTPRFYGFVKTARISLNGGKCSLQTSPIGPAYLFLFFVIKRLFVSINRGVT
uniref:Kinesin-like protein n=1 Tax=Echinococcus granulosus TaxID=6210 RepID=A0A068WTS8_ECHGR|nr:kinesin protein KIF16B [Echinococcus granulosus]